MQEHQALQHSSYLHCCLNVKRAYAGSMVTAAAATSRFESSSFDSVALRTCVSDIEKSNA